jgi:protein-S-isoprenylcysteine O-methyltransferase Ste14
MCAPSAAPETGNAKPAGCGHSLSSAHMMDIDIASVQKARKIALLLAIGIIGILIVVSAPGWPAPVEVAIQWWGRAMIFTCIAGRTWCTLYIGGRKLSELVTAGPYSVSRNPLYMFSIVGAVGAAVQVGALSVGFAAGVLAWIVHFLVVISEERLLLASHGEAFRSYAAQVPRFLPRLSGWKDVDLLDVRPHQVVTTFLDACFFLSAIPLTASVGYLQRAGLIPVLLRLF